MKILGNLNWEQEKQYQKKLRESIMKRWEKIDKQLEKAD